MVEFELEWDGNGPEGVDLPPFVEALALPPEGSVITWAAPDPEGDLKEFQAEVTAVELNIFEGHKGLYTVYVIPV